MCHVYPLQRCLRPGLCLQHPAVTVPAAQAPAQVKVSMLRAGCLPPGPVLGVFSKCLKVTIGPGVL